jgi:hypothetical protein
MILGSCPYDGCDGPLWLGIPDDAALPAYLPHDCETCKRKIWTKITRVDPCSWTEEGFNEEFIIDKETKQIELRNPPKPLTPKELIWQETINHLMKKWITEMMIYGSAKVEVPRSLFTNEMPRKKEV